MAKSTPYHKDSPLGEPPPTAAALALRLVAILGVMGLLLFVPAGRLNWVEAWVFIVSYGVFLSLYAVWGLSKDPTQLHERSRVGPNVKGWDKAIMAAYTVLLLLTLVVSGLDAGRFRWAPVALPLEVVAIGLLFAVRTSKEDQMLRQELAGYESYAHQVRYRLLPGVW